MILDKIVNELAEEYLKQSHHATREEVLRVLQEATQILRTNKDKTPEEIVNIIIEDCIKDLNEILINYPTPGILSQIKVDNININLYGGTIKNQEKLTPENLFDIASITKLYTQIIAYKLINERVFNLNTKIKELDKRFENVEDLTIEDILKFTTTFKTEGRIDDKQNKQEALETLFNMQVVQKGEEYNYNDMGLMLLKEVIENVTQKPFEELFEQYITKPYNLNDTHLIVPQEKIHLVTGTPNEDGSINDLKANILGGFSGHAGVRTTSEDLIKLHYAINKDYNLQNGLYVPNQKMEIKSEKIGSSYINPQTYTKKDGTVVSGKELSYFGRLAPNNSLASQGSTRVIARTSNFNETDINSTILTNISSMSDEQMLKAIEEENIRRLKQNPNAKLINPQEIMKERTYEGKTYKMHDARILMPEQQTIEKLSFKYDNEINLKLLLLNKILKEYEKYDLDININKDITNESPKSYR